MWLCTAAIIAFVATALLDLGGVWRWNVVALGLLLVIAGGVRLGVELVRRHTPPSGGTDGCPEGK